MQHLPYMDYLTFPHFATYIVRETSQRFVATKQDTYGRTWGFLAGSSSETMFPLRSLRRVR